MFIRDREGRGLTAKTIAIIRAHLPVEIDIGRVQIFLPAAR